MTCENCTPIKAKPGLMIKVDKIGDLFYCSICKKEITKVINTTADDHESAVEIHARALCAHSECLGLNSTNVWSVMQEQPAKYDASGFGNILKKWNLVNEEGEPTF